MGGGGQGERSARRSAPWLAAAAFLCTCLWAPAALAAPFNDDYADARVITGTSAHYIHHNVDATREAGEPDHGPNDGGVSIWYSWTAPVTGPTTISTCPTPFNTLLAVYTEAGAVPPFSNLSLFIANNDYPGCGIGENRSRVNFDAVLGTTYKIAVSGFDNPAIVDDYTDIVDFLLIAKGAPTPNAPAAASAPIRLTQPKKCLRKKKKRAAVAKKKRCGKKKRRK